MAGSSYHALTPTDSAEQVEEYLEALFSRKISITLLLREQMAPEKVVSVKPF